MLYRAPSAVQKPSVVLSISEMLAYRDTWGSAFEEDLEAKLAPPPPPEKVPSKPLVVSENAFRAGSSSSLDKSEVLVRLVQSTLNKLTAENFDLLIPDLLQPALFEPGVADRVVEKVFEKSLDEPKYAPLYATLCFHLAAYERTYLDSSKKIRTSIVGKAQETYEAQRTAGTGGADDEEAAERLRKRKLANIKFVGHLVQRELVSTKIVAFILTNTAQSKSDIDVEVAVALVDQVGVRLEEQQHHSALDPFFAFLKKRLDDTDTPHTPRVKFLIMNLIDLRKRKWVRTTPAEVDPSAVVTAPPPKPKGVALTASEVAVALEKRPPLAPDVSPSEIKNATKKLLEMTEADHEDALRSLSTVLKDYNPAINRAAIVAFVIENLCLSTNAQPREQFLGQMHLIEQQELRAGQAWAVANSVVSVMTVDCPNYYKRLSPMLLVGLKDRAGYKAMLKDVLTVATKAIDDVYDEMEGDLQWDEAYLDMWTALFATSKAHAAEKKNVVPPLGEILDFLSQVPTTGVAGRVMTDVLSALVDTGFTSPEDLKKWHTNHHNSAKLAFICDAMSLLV